jgi:hypothetical protein
VSTRQKLTALAAALAFALVIGDGNETDAHYKLYLGATTERIY